MCNENFNDYIFSIVLIDYKSHDSRTLNGEIHVENGNENDLEVICSKFHQFLDIAFGDEKC